jgi:hypothetical protein
MRPGRQVVFPEKRGYGVKNLLCFWLYHLGIGDLFGRETHIPGFWRMPSWMRLAIWRFTARVHMGAIAHEVGG